MWAYVYRNFLVWRRNWYMHLALYLFAPVSIMYGLSINFSDIQGLENYTRYIVPGFMGYSALLSAFFNMAWGCFTKLEHQKTYHALLATSLSLPEILLSEIIWSTVRSTLMGVCVGLAAWGLFVHVSVSYIILQIPYLALGAFAGSVFGLCVCGLAKSYDDLTVFESLISALFIFSGVFTFFDKFPIWIQWFAQVFPLYHTVALLRTGALENLFALICISCVSFIVALYLMQRRIIS